MGAQTSLKAGSAPGGVARRTLPKQPVWNV